LASTVRVPFDVMPGRRDQLVQHGRVARSGFGDDLAWCQRQHRQGTVGEAAGAIGVAAGRNEHVNDLASLIDSPVHVAPDTINLQVRFVKQPPVA
jgi:hypothetical protein